MVELTKYESEELLQSTLYTLNRFYSAEMTLLSKAGQVLLVNNKDSDAHKCLKEVNKLLPQLRQAMCVNVEDEDSRNVICRTLRKFTYMCVLEDDQRQPIRKNQIILRNAGELMSQFKCSCCLLVIS